MELELGIVLWNLNLYLKLQPGNWNLEMELECVIFKLGLGT